MVYLPHKTIAIGLFLKILTVSFLVLPSLVNAKTVIRQPNDLACEIFYKTLRSETHPAEIAVSPLKCTHKLLSNGWEMIRVKTSCGGDSCHNLAWLKNPDGKTYFLDGEHANGEILVLWDTFIITETMRLTADMNYTPNLVIHESESHPSPYLNCGSPSITPDQKWLWCRKLDGSTWRIRLSVSDFPATDQLELVTKYSGNAPLYVVPYAWITPPKVRFQKDNVAVVTHIVWSNIEEGEIATKETHINASTLIPID